MRLKQIQAAFSESPADLPVTVQEAKEHCRVTTDEDDGYIENLIKAAAEYAQDRTGRAIGYQVWEGALDAFPCGIGEIALPLSPALLVDEITYVDPNGDVQTVDPDTYFLNDYGSQHSIIPKLDETWPATAAVYPGTVKVRFMCGYSPQGSPPLASLPARLRQAILVMVNEMYDNRVDGVDEIQADMRGAVDALLRPSRVNIW